MPTITKNLGTNLLLIISERELYIHRRFVFKEKLVQKWQQKCRKHATLSSEEHEHYVTYKTVFKANHCEIYLRKRQISFSLLSFLLPIFLITI